MASRVLFVDDESRLLEGIARTLRGSFDIHTATSGEEGLNVLQSSGPFAVVVSDMGMPKMNGAQFLGKARDLCPQTVRIVLSGQSDMVQTIAAVNEGNIFRFLSKPCSTQDLLAAVRMGVEQHRLITAERELLEQTLGGAMNLLVDILNIVSPAAYGRARRLHGYVLALVSALKLGEHWQWPLAALVSPIGCILLRPDTLYKVEAGQALTMDERRLFESHPKMAGKMLETIPRLEEVAAIVAGQNSQLSEPEVRGELGQRDVRSAGKILLRAAVELDRYVLEERNSGGATATALGANTGLPTSVIDAMREICATAPQYGVRMVRLRDLTAGMVLVEALITSRGVCLVPANMEITPTLLLRLCGIDTDLEVKEPFQVRAPL
jgi:response regulator RpfG family c-di-GMP phosphodiesterase